MPEQPGEHKSLQPTGRNQRAVQKTSPSGPLLAVHASANHAKPLGTPLRVRRERTRCFIEQHLQEIGLGKATIQRKRKRPTELIE